MCRYFLVVITRNTSKQTFLPTPTLCPLFFSHGIYTFPPDDFDRIHVLHILPGCSLVDNVGGSGIYGA